MIDITRALQPGHPNWPGDTPLTLELTARIEDGSSVNVMRLETSTHAGTHLDAPFHYLANGGRLGSITLEQLVGEAVVVRVSGPPGAEAVTKLLEQFAPLPPRVLIATGQPPRWDRFPADFTPLTPQLIHALADRGVQLVGTDSPSVDAFDSKELPVHRACGARGMLIVEGLQLADVSPGRYRLICLPLNLPTADASPVRAVLEPL